MANEKIITQDVFEQSIKDILTLLVNNTYNFTEYTDEEVGNLIDLDPTQIAELTAVISDSVVAKNKVFSSSHTTELIQKSVIESNEYADSLVANLSNIKLDIVDTLPDASTVNKSTIYILKDSTGGTNNTLNVWSDSTSAFVEVGKLNVNMDSYYTKSDVDTLLADKADDNTVVHQDDVVSDMTTTSGTTVLSTSGLKTELDKKANNDAVVKTADIATTIDSASTDSKVASAKAVYDTTSKFLKTYTSIKQLGLTSGSETIEDIAKNMESFTRLIAIIEGGTSIYPYTNGTLIVEKLNPYRVHFKFCMDELPMVFVGAYHAISGFTGWKRLCTTSVADIPNTPILSEHSSVNINSGFYSVKNGICYVSLWGVIFSEVGLNKLVKQNLPKAAQHVSSPIIAANNTGDVIGYAFIDDGLNLKVHAYQTGLLGYGSFSYPVAES